MQTTLDYCPTTSNTYKRSPQRLSTAALQTGLEIITQKTKSKRVNTAANTPTQMAGQHIEDVEKLHLLRKHYQQD